MATVTTLAGSTSGGNTARRVPYVVDVEIDFAAAATAKESALAAGDIIEALNVPAGAMVLTAGIEVTAANVGGSNDVTLDLGVTGGDIDIFVDGFDYDAASVGDYAAVPAATGPVMFGSADTIDVEIQTATTAPTGGKIRVFAVMVDVDGVGFADEVVRDQLA